MEETVAAIIRPLPPKYWLAIAQAVARVASDDQTRGTFCGVRIECDGNDLLLTSTDTYRLLSVRVPGGVASRFDRAVTADADALVAACKAAKGSASVSIYVDDDGVLTVTGGTGGRTDVQSTVRTIPGTYVDWRALITEDTGYPHTGTVSYNPALLAGLLESMALIGSYADRPKNRPLPRVELVRMDAGKPSRFTMTGPDDVQATGLIMPVRK